jgi:flavin reductase (DIM6/NTAB) family NADH-FMN oxidoreductase RutF
LGFKQWIRETILGISIPQEYVCIELEGFQHSLSSFLTSKDGVDIVPVRSDILLGYRPLILAFPFERSSREAAWLRDQEAICLTMVNGGFHGNEMWRGFQSDKSAVARIVLRNIHVREFLDQTVVVFEGVHGEHKFLGSWHQFTNRLRERFRITRPDNYLEGNLYDQVRIGYARPRVISMITVQDDDGKLNMFPTDLHGAVGEEGYAGSMRHGGKADSQIEKASVIALSNVRSDWFREAYALGKNHMADPKPDSEFSLSSVRTKAFGIPLPASVVRYRELRRIDSIDVGIHRIHFYEVVHEARVEDMEDTLAHIHCFYAQWRKNRGVPSEYMIR